MKNLYKVFSFFVVSAILLTPFVSFAVSPTNEGIATASEVLVVYNSAYTADSDNDSTQDSLELANYYSNKRSVPSGNVVGINTPTTLAITRSDYNTYIKNPLEVYLTNNNLKNRIKYIVYTKGIPLKVYDTSANANNYVNVMGDYSSVDSSTTLLFQDGYIGTTASILNPYYSADPNFSLNYRFKSNTFGSDYKISYLVTRLDGYTVADVKNMIDRAYNANNSGSGYFILDKYSGNNNFNFDNMSVAQSKLASIGKNTYPNPFSINSSAIKSAPGSVVGYTSYGLYGGLPNNYYKNALNFSYLNGAVASTYESYSAFTMTEPDNTDHGQIAQFIRAGGSGGIGNVYEPFASAIAEENIWMPAYAAGYTWADAAYMSLPSIDWTGVVFGDPLMGINPNAISSTNYPKILSVSSSKQNGAYNDIDERTYDSEVIDIVVTFSESVTSTGPVTVTLETGNIDRTCEFTITSLTSAHCDYIVRSGDATNDLSVKSITGVIKNSQNVAVFDFVPETNLDVNKDIVIDTINPIVTSFTPTNNTTNVASNSNLIINFSEPVFVKGGNITIKQVSDNSIVEVIQSDSSMVSGDGTNTITINPSFDLNGNTSYYLLINTNAFNDIAGNVYFGISNNTELRFTTQAIKPSVQTISATLPTKNSIRLTGSVDSFGTYDPIARGFEYGTTKSYGSASINNYENGSIPIGIYIANLRGLICNATYYYRAYVTYNSGISYGEDKTFTTSACSNTPPTTPGTPTTTTPTKDTTPTFTWTASSSVNGLNSTPYIIEISKDNTFATGVTNTTSNTNSYTPSTLTDGTYYIRVKAKDVSGLTSNYSNTGTVLIDNVAPPIPANITGTTPTSDTTPTISWDTVNDDNTGGSGMHSSAPYSIVYAKDSNFSVGKTVVNITINSFTPATALSTGKWYFHVRSRDKAVNPSEYGGTLEIVIQ